MTRPEVPVVLFDLDNTVADFDRAVQTALLQQHPHVAHPEERTNFYISHDFAEEHQALVRSISDQEGFFDSLPLVRYAITGLQRIIDHGYHPRVCSSPLSSNPGSTDEKMSWIARELVPHFGSYMLDEALITKDKAAVGGIALIDDRPTIADADTASWEHIIFDQPYNRASQQPRLYSWLDSRLPKLLHAAEVHTLHRQHPARY